MTLPSDSNNLKGDSGNVTLTGGIGTDVATDYFATEDDDFTGVP